MIVAGATRKILRPADMAAIRLALFLVAALLWPESRVWSYAAWIDSTAGNFDYSCVSANLPGGQDADYGYDSAGRMDESILKTSGGSGNAGCHCHPFGNTISKSETRASGNPHRYSSKRLDYAGPEAIYYYGYRFYDPDLQRWINRDPLGEVGGINLYQFVSNNPVNRIDPDGRLAPAVGVSAAIAVSPALGTAVAVIGIGRLGQMAIEAWTPEDPSSDPLPLPPEVQKRRDERSPIRCVIGQDQRFRVIPAAQTMGADVWDPMVDGPLSEWLDNHISRQSQFIDIGYDSDNPGAPSLYDYEADYLNSRNYPRTLTPWPGSQGGLPGLWHP